ncbi:hypothetical protein BKA63DRAFT_489988 [Paraphoma chrysanthemicola]|nr:hypothetical protein BKA63DRAFT_489988 [Paraphoma chrysanthemicola]
MSVAGTIFRCNLRSMPSSRAKCANTADKKSFENAKPSVLADGGADAKHELAREARSTDTYIKDVQRGVKSCKHYMYKSEPHSIHVWFQAPAHIFAAFSEAFIISTGHELAFTQAPTTKVDHSKPQKG